MPIELQTLAEGIEDQAQLAALQRERCDQGQGFLFARPLDVEGIERFFEHSRRAVQPTGTVAA